MVAGLRHLGESQQFGCRIVVFDEAEAPRQALLDGDGGFITGSVPDDLIGPIVSDAVALMDLERTVTLSYGGREVFFEVVAPRPRMLIFGAVHIAQSLVPMAHELGFSVALSDARPAFITEGRFPDADELLVGWPDDVSDSLALDRRTFVVILSHDARYEDPLWPLVLPSPVRYIGAMGSRRTAQARRERLLADGWDDAAVDRIRGPIGLDIGAESPAEIAVSILAEITSHRHGIDAPPDLAGEPVRLGKSQHL